jgi:hypothetical protein
MAAMRVSDILKVKGTVVKRSSLPQTFTFAKVACRAVGAMVVKDANGGVLGISRNATSRAAMICRHAVSALMTQTVITCTGNIVAALRNHDALAHPACGRWAVNSWV